MKKFVSLIFVALFFAISADDVLAQRRNTTTEVLYFKDQLRCCHARRCNALETTVERIIQENFPEGQVTLRQIRLDDPENSELIEKYGATSQTLIVISTRRRKENTADISDVLRNYNRNRNLAILEQQLIENISETFL